MGTRNICAKTIFTAAVILVLSSVLPAAEKKNIRPAGITQTDKCQVCGMFVAKYPVWVAQVVFSDGSYSVFDGPKDMFKYYFNLSRYAPSKNKTDISAFFVTEYYSKKMVDGQKAFFVQGSDVYGPMGAELVPVESLELAREFMKDHNGKKVLKFSEVAPGDLK